jgi:hypothetical protein
MADSKLERGAGTGLVKSEAQYTPCLVGMPSAMVRTISATRTISGWPAPCTLCILHPALNPAPGSPTHAFRSPDVIQRRRDRLDMWLPCLVSDNDALQL